MEKHVNIFLTYSKHVLQRVIYAPRIDKEQFYHLSLDGSVFVLSPSENDI